MKSVRPLARRLARVVVCSWRGHRPTTIAVYVEAKVTEFTHCSLRRTRLGAVVRRFQFPVPAQRIARVR